LKVREQETLDAFSRLMDKKRQLVKLVQESVNRTKAPVDISLSEELDELRRIITGQESKIQHLRMEISKKGTPFSTQDWQESRMTRAPSASRTRLNKWRRRSK
jgi:hypothetical protein